MTSFPDPDGPEMDDHEEPAGEIDPYDLQERDLSGED